MKLLGRRKTEEKMKDNMKMDLWEVDYEGSRWTELDRTRVVFSGGR
jgi:hypothetical protein